MANSFEFLPQVIQRYMRPHSSVSAGIKSKGLTEACEDAGLTTTGLDPE
jgi:hypothetical protein